MRGIEIKYKNQFEEFSKVSDDNLTHGLLNNLKQVNGDKNSDFEEKISKFHVIFMRV